jgi:hypothetical protein
LFRRISFASPDVLKGVKLGLNGNYMALDADAAAIAEFEGTGGARRKKTAFGFLFFASRVNLSHNLLNPFFHLRIVGSYRATIFMEKVNMDLVGGIDLVGYCFHAVCSGWLFCFDVYRLRLVESRVNTIIKDICVSTATRRKLKGNQGATRIKNAQQLP